MKILESLHDLGLIFRLIPEEEQTLTLFLVGSASCVDRLESIGMNAAIVDDGRDSHRSWSKILNLFESEIHIVCLGSEFGHIDIVAAGMRTDKIRDELLVEMFLLINLVELLLELMEEAEIGFTHNVEYSLGSMFGSDLETSGDMLGYKFASIVVMAASLVGSTSFGQKDIVANTASDERLLDLGKSVDLVIELDERRKVGVHILAHLGEDA